MKSLLKKMAKNLIEKILARFGYKIVKKWDSPPSLSLEDLIRAYNTPAQNKSILFIEDRFPFPELGAGYPRTVEMIMVMLSYGYSVDLFPMNNFNEDYERSIQLFNGKIRIIRNLFASELLQFLSLTKNQYNNILVSRPHNMAIFRDYIPVVRKRMPAARIIYDAEAIYALREQLMHQRQNKSGKRDFSNEIRDEISLSKNVDSILAVSAREAHLFESHGVKKTHVVGHSVQTRNKVKTFHARRGVLFLGSYHGKGSPNHDAVMWLLSEIIPRVLENSDISFTIAGYNMDRLIIDEGINTDSRVRIIGTIPSTEPLLQNHRVFVAPVRYAAGVPLKIIEAASFGIPVVATNLMGDQLGWRNGKEIFCEDNAAIIAKHISELHSNATLWSRVSKASLSRLRTEYSAKVFANQVITALKG